MSQVFKTGDLLVLDLGEEQSKAPGLNIDFQLLSPLLLGLLVPFMAVAYFEPEAMRHLKGAIWTFLLLMFLVCSVLFFYTHHVPGKIDSIIVDRETRTIEIVWRNLLATATQIVPFQDISALRVRQDYGVDGNAKPIAELVLRSSPPIDLPSSITDDQLRPLRAAIGLG